MELNKAGGYKMNIWKYVWLNEKGNPQKSSRYNLKRPDAIYAPEFIWRDDESIKAYLAKIPRIGAILEAMVK